jgi:hypothetical protein
MPRRFSLLLCGLAPVALALFSQARAQVQPNADPASWAARDSHQNVTVAVKALTSEADYKARFTGHTPYEAGIVALDVYIRNDNDKPVRLKLDTIRIFVDRSGQPSQPLDALAPEDVADRVVLKKPSDIRGPRLPVPIGRTPSSNRSKDWQEFAAQIRRSSFPSDVVGPHSTVRGFVFFDVNRRYDSLREARLEIPDIAFMVNSEPLFFFEVDLAPAIH